MRNFRKYFIFVVNTKIINKGNFTDFLALVFMKL